MNMKDAISSYVAARDAAGAANAVTVQTADKAYRFKRELDHAEAQVLLAAHEYEQARFAHESAAGMEHWANDSVTMAKAALAKAVKDNVPNRNVPRAGGDS
jgi:hypothetical protein